MINLNGIRVTGLTFQGSEIGKLPTILILGLTQENRVYLRSYDATQIKESLKTCIAKKESDVRQGIVLSAMLVMLGEIVTEEDLEILSKEALENVSFA